MEEPKKVLRAQYLGCTQVNQATGMEVLNEAIDRLVTTIPEDHWQIVNVAVAPSMISIQQPNVSFPLIHVIMYIHVYNYKVVLGSQVISGMQGSLLVLLGNREKCKAVRVRNAHGARYVHGSRFSLRTIIRCAL